MTNPPRFASPRTAIVRLFFCLYGALLVCASGAAQTAVPYAGAPSFEIKKLAGAGNSFFAIGGDAALYHARVGEDWQSVSFSGKNRVIDIATDGKKVLLVSVEEERGEGEGSSVARVRTFALNDGQKPYYADLGFTHPHNPKAYRFRLHYGGGRFVAWAGSEIMTATDGKGWEAVALPEEWLRAKAVHFADGYYLVPLDSDEGLLRTRDFKTWEPPLPVITGAYMEDSFVMAGDGRAIFQYAPRLVDKQTGKVHYEDNLMVSADGGVTWTGLSGLSTSADTRLLGAFYQARERHWLVFNDGLFGSVGNSLTKWRRINALEGRKLAAIGSDSGLFAEVVPLRGLMPFAPNMDLMLDSKACDTRPVPAMATEQLLAQFIEWDNAASEAKSIAEFKAATTAFASHAKRSLAPEAVRLRLLAFERFALFAPLPDIVEVAGPLASNAISSRLPSRDRMSFTSILSSKLRRPKDAETDSLYRHICEKWEEYRVAFEPPKRARPARNGYCDRETFQKRVFDGDAGAMLDLVDGYSTGRAGIVSKLGWGWWSTQAPDTGKEVSDAEYLQFSADHGSAVAKLTLLRNKYKAASGKPRPPMSDNDMAELEKLFDLGVNEAAFMLVVEYSSRYDKEPVTKRNLLPSKNAQSVRTWASRGAGRGYGASMMHFAQVYEQGIGGVKNTDSALEWARRAVATGHPDAVAFYTPEKLVRMEHEAGER